MQSYNPHAPELAMEVQKSGSYQDNQHWDPIPWKQRRLSQIWTLYAVAGPCAGPWDEELYWVTIQGDNFFSKQGEDEQMNEK